MSPGHRASYSVKYSPSRSTLFFVTVSYIKKMLLYLSKSQCSRVPNPPQVCLTHTLPPTVVTRPTPASIRVGRGIEENCVRDSERSLVLDLGTF